MKRTIIIAIVAVICMSANAQMSVDRLIKNYKNKPNVEYTHVPKLMLSLAKKMSKSDKEMDSYSKMLDSVEVIDLESCDKSTKQSFLNDVKQLNDSGYEELIKINDKGEKVLILAKSKKDVIQELLIVSANLDDAAVVRLKGKLKRSHLDEIVNQHQK